MSGFFFQRAQPWTSRKPWQAPTGDWQQQNWGQQDQQWQWGDSWTAPAPSTNDAVGSGNVGSGNVGSDGDGAADNAARPAPDTTPSRPTGPAASPRPGPSCIICLEGVSGYPIFLPCAHGPFHHLVLFALWQPLTSTAPFVDMRQARPGKIVGILWLCSFC